jgi:tripartite-type tricarboxylate transporter receptor subunit TctC
MPTGIFQRTASVSVALIVGLLCTEALLAAESYPSKPVRFIVPTSAGGPNDRLARMVGNQLNGLWGQAIVVENREGASGIIAAEAMLRSPSDGYSALFTSTVLVQTPSLLDKIPYDVTRDFAPVTQVARLSAVLVTRPDPRFKSLNEYLAAARSPNAQVTYGSFGLGSSVHIYGEVLKRDANAPLVHVPYKGEVPALADMVGGRLDSFFLSPTNAVPQVKAGKLTPLAVIGRVRNPSLPDVPTFEELGYRRLDLSGWFGILMNSNAPKEIVARMSADIRKLLGRADLKASIQGAGLEPTGTTPDEFAAIMAKDQAVWRQLIKEIGLKAN